MAIEAKLLRDGCISDPTIWSTGEIPGPEDTAVIDGNVLTLNMGWRVGTLRVHVYDGKDLWDYVDSETFERWFHCENVIVTYDDDKEPNAD